MHFVSYHLLICPNNWQLLIAPSVGKPTCGRHWYFSIGSYFNYSFI